MINKDLIKKIRYHFGLNVYESSVWIALLSKGTATVGEIAQISGVPRSRVYDVLESLEKQGFVIAQLGKPVRYMTLKPSAIIDRLKSNLLKEANERVNLLSNVKETEEYKQLESLHNRGIDPIKPEELNSYIRGRDNIYNQLKQMISEAQKEVILVTNTGALKKKMVFLKPLINRMKNGKVNFIIGASNSTQENDKVNFSKELGIPVRKLNVNARFCIVDGNKTLFMITPGKEEENDVAILVKSPFFSKALTSFLNLSLQR